MTVLIRNIAQEDCLFIIKIIKSSSTHRKREITLPLIEKGEVTLYKDGRY